jgi:hypothetical protein
VQRAPRSSELPVRHLTRRGRQLAELALGI